MAMCPKAKPVEGKGGDEGVDAFIGDFDGECQVFQHKYFTTRLLAPQRRQVSKSLKTALSGKRRVFKWVLILAHDLTPAEIRWFAELQTEFPDTALEWWGKTKLQSIVGEYPEIGKDYQPKPTIVVLMLNRGVDLRSNDETEIAQTFREALGNDLPEDVLINAARDLKNRTSLRVLIWGPSAGAGDIYQKRVELKNKLSQLGHDVHFSEDVCTPELLAKTGLNLSVAELIQATHFDYVVCLMASPGSIGEVHDFACIKKIAVKMMICVDRRHRQGYSAAGALRIFEGYNGRLDWFEYPTDIRDCHLAGRVIEQIHKVAEKKQWEISTGRASS
jgi:hypothetical protein